MADIPMCEVANGPIQTLNDPKLADIVGRRVLSKMRKEVDSNPSTVIDVTTVSRGLTVSKRVHIVDDETKPLVLVVPHKHITNTNTTREWIIIVLTKAHIL